MTRSITSKSSACKIAKLSAISISLSTAVWITPALAVEFEYDEISGSWDTTLSYGLGYRADQPDQRIIGMANGGSAFSVNGDDGNLNYDKGIFSNAIKITSEAEVNYRNYGGFIRGSAFYDYENKKNDRERTPLSDDAKDLVASQIKLLDAYVWSQFDVGDNPAEIRFGQQLLSWGESTFIQNSINVINPVDVSAIRVPGAELREALVPVPIIAASLSTTENTSVEVFYQLRWQETIIDPPGSYFSTNDFAGEGGERVMLGFGNKNIPDTIPLGTVVSPPANSVVVPRGSTREASDSGQFGIAYRLYAPELNDTEFGFYYLNYHSRVPVINATTGTRAAAAGLDPQGRTYVETARYFTSYPEDIKLLGFSFNTTLGRSGVALQGEISHRKDAPLQIDDVEILFAALGAQDNLSPGNTRAAEFAKSGQLGLIPFETDILGFIKRNITQTQFTVTKLFGPVFQASESVLLGEVALTYVHNMPDKNELRLEGPGTYASGNTALAADSRVPDLVESPDRFASTRSWGYRVVGRLDYNNVIGAINLSPRFAWQHDVQGISPGPGGNFIKGRKIVTLGLGASFQNQWTADLSYTRYFGAGRYNLLNDRNFIAANIKYSF